MTTPPITDKERIAAASARLGEQIGRELVNAYIATLRNEADVKINQQALDEYHRRWPKQIQQRPRLGKGGVVKRDKSRSV